MDASFRLCASGVTYLYAATSAGVNPMWSRYLISATEQDGGRLYPVSPGDLNGDGVDDLAVGADGFVTRDMPGVIGAVFVYLGGAWTWVAPSMIARAMMPGIDLGTKLY